MFSETNAMFKRGGNAEALFLLSALYYFYVPVYNNPSNLSTVFKCLPIFCLMWVVFNKGGKYSAHKGCYLANEYSKKILIGLALSSIGDAFLDNNKFTYGMLFFGLAQTRYIQAFGFKPLNLRRGIFLYILSAIVIVTVYKNLENELIFGVPIYTLLLTTMCWRSLSFSSLTEREKLANYMRAIGGILFTISDLLICIDKFHTEIPNAMFYIMLTYYISQFLIASSTLT